MKKLAFAILVPLFCTSFLAPGHETPQSQTVEKLPAEISEFYNDYNFVCSFSSPQERKKLAFYFDQDDLPKSLSSGRLDKVFYLMKKLFEQIDFIDPRMVVRVKPEAPSWANVFRSELYVIEGVSLGKEKASIEVGAYELEPEIITKFISQYSEDAGDESEKLGPAERMEMVKTRIVKRKEFHKWRRRNNKWLKDEAKLIFIKR
jgi:hypothetical protein